MFSLREYIMQGFMDAIGKMSDYQIILNSAGWQKLGVLMDEDLAKIQEAINKKNETDIMTTEEPVVQDANVDEPIGVI